MRLTTVTVLCLATVLGSGALPAAEEDAKKEAGGKLEDKGALYARLAQGPSGVCKPEIQKDAGGRISAVLVVGKSPISTVLGKAKGIEIAQQRAVNAAKAKFLQWLKEDVSVTQSQEDETVILREGVEEAGQEDAFKESGRGIDKNTTKFQTVSNGLLRGLQVVYYNQDGKEKTYTVIMKWDAQLSDAAGRTYENLNGRQGELQAPLRPENNAKRRPENKDIPSRNGVLDD